MGIIEDGRKCCAHCTYWHGCLVIAKYDGSFSCNTCYCKLFERNDKPSLNDKLRGNEWIIPDILHLEDE